MKISLSTRLYSKITVCIVALVINNKIVCVNGLSENKLCKAARKESCVILCRDWNKGSNSAVEELKEILREEGKRFKSCTLKLKGCIHANATWNEINPDEKPIIEDLKIIHSKLDLNKLNLSIFKHLRTLRMKNTTTTNLHSEVFRQLPNLKQLHLIRNNNIKWVEKGFLQNLSLDILQIQDINLNQQQATEFFKNLTAGCDISGIQELDSFHNVNFKNDLLDPFINLNVLILTNSSVFKFYNFSNRYIKSGLINKNEIQNLSEKFFRLPIENNSFLSQEANDFICDFNMKKSQSLRSPKFTQKLQITCVYPEGVQFLGICPEKKSTESPLVNCTSKENSEIFDNYNLLSKSIRFFPISSYSPKFTITKDEPELIEITISDTMVTDQLFLWYGDYANTTSPKFKCLKILQQKFSMNVTPEINYLICLAMTDKNYQTDIFNCLPFKTKPHYENEPWLTKKSISISIICIFIIILFALTMGALILYLSVRKNPSLIRGSKRVIEVKRHDKAQVLIMPRGYESARQPDPPSLMLMNPRLPLMPSRSRLSFDTSSTVSYVSAHQPTPLEILTYRLSRLRELFQRNNNLPSPVTPMPMQITTPINQRLPPNVDLLLEYEWYTITTTTTTTTTTRQV